METIILALLGLNPTNDAFISYETKVKPIFSQSCASCHSGDNKLPNLMTYDGAFKYRFQIKRKMNDRSMPHIGSIKESERDLVRAWVNEGAKK